MKANLNRFERVVRVLMGLFALFAAVSLFTHPIARLLSALFGAYALFEALTAWCPAHANLGVLTPADRLKPETTYKMGLSGAQAILAYEWFGAGWEKIASGGFVSGMAKTLAAFAGKNPFGWYASFLNGWAASHAALLGYAVEWGELLVGAVLAVSAWGLLCAKSASVRRWALIASVPALFGGLLMSANFYLAAGWSGPGTRGINVVMFWVEAVLLYVWLARLEAEGK